MTIYKFKALGNYKFSIGERLVPIKIEHGEIDTTLHLVRQKDYIKMKNVTSEYESLSDRELDVMNLVVMGYDNKQISEKLCIEHSTLKCHIHSIYKKFNLGTTETGTMRIRAALKYQRLIS